MAPKPKKDESGPLFLIESAVLTHLRSVLSVPSFSCEPAVLYGGFAHVYCSSIFYTMGSMVSKTQKTKTIMWTDEEVGLLLNVFAEETIQIGLEKAKCPKDKNAVYLEVKKKLEQHGKFSC